MGGRASTTGTPSAVPVSQGGGAAPVTQPRTARVTLTRVRMEGPVLEGVMPTPASARMAGRGPHVLTMQMTAILNPAITVVSVWMA